MAEGDGSEGEGGGGEGGGEGGRLAATTTVSKHGPRLARVLKNTRTSRYTTARCTHLHVEQ